MQSSYDHHPLAPPWFLFRLLPGKIQQSAYSIKSESGCHSTKSLSAVASRFVRGL